MIDMTMQIMPGLMNDDIASEMNKMLDGTNTYGDIVEYLGKNGILTSPTALARFKHISPIYHFFRLCQFPKNPAKPLYNLPKIS